MTTNTRGFTLVETLFYTAGFLLLLGTMVTFLFYMYTWYQQVTMTPRIDRIGINLVDRITKEIRSGTNINIPQSDFDTTLGSIDFDASVNSASVTKRMALEDGHITYREDGGTESTLSPREVTISRFYVTATTTSISQGVRFEIDIPSVTRTGSTTQTYSGFALLRQSYE